MIDSHCHINDPSFKDHPEEYINLGKSAGIAEFLVVSYDEKSSRIAVDIAKNYSECFAAVGIHPSDVKRMKKGDLESIEKLAKNDRVLAIGEIGLDYYYDTSTKEAQK